jgi:hypothetical protein
MRPRPAARVAQLWEQLQNVTNRQILHAYWPLPSSRSCTSGKDDVFHAIEQHAKAAEAGDGDQKEYPDLLTPEWDIFTATPPLEPA